MSAIQRIPLILAFISLAGNLYAQSGIQVDSQDGLLSVQANNVSASELAEELSQQLGISVVVTGDAETRINLDIVEEPFEKALGKLSPNHMLVRNQNASEITEVVLMMGDAQGSSGSAGAEEFLPTGSPTEGIVEDLASDSDDNDLDPSALRDPNRAAQVREVATDASNDPNFPATQVPSTFTNDRVPDIDPTTGLPYD